MDINIYYTKQPLYTTSDIRKAYNRDVKINLCYILNIMVNRQTFQIVISGYIAEIVCGQIPVECKDSFTRHLLQNRIEAEIPEWLLRRNPNYVSPDRIKQVWYFDNRVMQGIMKRSGHDWRTYRDINNFCHLSGFGSGKTGIGIFEVGVVVDQKPVLEFVPFEPPPETGDRLKKMEDIKLTWRGPVPLPSPNKGYIAVSAGSWGKGAIRFSAEITEEFDGAKLELLVSDLSNIGVGEDHFVSGVRYAGKKLEGEIVKQGDKDMYQVSWYSPHKERWLEMCEADPSDLTL